MTTSNETKRDLQLLSLLIERELDEGGCADVLRGSSTSLEPMPEREDRLGYELRFDLLKGVQASVTDTWWSDRDRSVEDICEQAASIACSVAALRRERDEIKAMLSEVAAAVRREIAKAQRRDIPYRLVSVDVSPMEAGSTEFPYIEVRLERLGPSLLPETVTLDFDTADQIKPTFAEMLETQKARRMRQVVLEAAAADGEIDEVALRIMQIQGCDVPAILARLPHADGGVLDVELPGFEGRDRQIVLFWRDGVVHANVPLTDTVGWWQGKISFKKAPTRFPAQPKGRLLSDFIEHEALPKDLRIVSGYRLGETASAGVPVPTVRFNAKTGKAWAA